MCEAGFTRAKNTGNILMKNLMDFCIGTPTYWILGFGLMFAGSGAIIGGLDPFVRGDYAAILPAGVPLFAYLIFQTVFCATSATIVSGSMAERTKFISYCLYSFCISAFIYPISGHWIWGGGWLSQMGFHDFAGSTAVHMVGVSAPASARPSWVPGSASTTMRASPGPSWATACPWGPWGCSSSGSAGSVSTAAPPSAWRETT